MGDRGPMPKENPLRANKESQPIVIEETDGKVSVEMPPLTSYFLSQTQTEGFGSSKKVFEITVEVEFGQHAREMWETVWSSALAKQFRPEMVDALWRWIKLVDRFHNLGDHSVGKEILVLEKEYALTWNAQKRARLQFAAGSAPKAAEPEGEKPKPRAKGGRTHADRRATLRAVSNE